MHTQLNHKKILSAQKRISLELKSWTKCDSNYWSVKIILPRLKWTSEFSYQDEKCSSWGLLKRVNTTQLYSIKLNACLLIFWLCWRFSLFIKRPRSWDKKEILGFTESAVKFQMRIEGGFLTKSINSLSYLVHCVWDKKVHKSNIKAFLQHDEISSGEKEKLGQKSAALFLHLNFNKSATWKKFDVHFTCWWQAEKCKVKSQLSENLIFFMSL